MKKSQQHSCTIFLLCITFLITNNFITEAKTCKPSGALRGKKPPPRQCYIDSCCEEGKFYPAYKCSPRVSNHTKATLTLNCFDKNCDGGAPSECDEHYHSDDDPIVALSTGWYNMGRRCERFVRVHGNNGRSVRAKVVDDCDSTRECDAEHDFQPPCMNNSVNGSIAVWKALGVPEEDWGEMDVF